MNPKYYLIFLVLFGCSITKNTKDNKQETNSFEGYVTYKFITPKPDKISDEEWKLKLKEITGEQGFVLQKNYYKSGQFAAEINSGLAIGKQIYNAKDSLHYAWQLESDTVTVQDYNKESFIKIKEIIELDTIATINKIDCKAIRVNMTIGHVLIWYNSNLIHIEEDTYKGTLFGRKTINKIKTLPIRSEIPGLLIIDMIEFKSQELDSTIFEIPEFKVVEEMPSF